jgi:hypothetical protein
MCPDTALLVAYFVDNHSGSDILKPDLTHREESHILRMYRISRGSGKAGVSDIRPAFSTQKRGVTMTVILIIVAIVAAIYIYAAAAYYYGFKNWHPLCGCRKTELSCKRTS